MKKLWLLAMIHFMYIPMYTAQNECNISVSGVVTDEHDNSELAFSTIWIPSLQKGVAANEKGEYLVENLCPEKYLVVISHIGCLPDSVWINLTASEGKVVSKNFQLEHHLEELREVQISEKREKKLLVRTENLQEEELEENRGKPLGEILKSVNGVNSLQTGANISKPVIGGFTANRVQLINQGVQLQSQQWGNEHAPEVDPFAASIYKVIKGAGAVKYSGGALGGLVVIESKELPKKVGINGAFTTLYATNNRLGNASLLLEGNMAFLPQFSWRVQGSIKRSGNVKTPNYYQKNTGVKEWNGSVDFGYSGKNWDVRFFYSQFNSEIGIFSGAHIGNLTDLRNAINRSEPREEDQEGFSYEIRRPFQRIEHELAKLEFNQSTESFGDFNLKLSRQFNIREEFDKERPRNNDLAKLDIPEFSLGLESFTSQLNWQVPQWRRFKTEVGVQWLVQENSINSFTDFIPDFTAQKYSFYFLEQWKKEKLELELGIRFDRNEMKIDKLINREFQRFERDFTALTTNLGASFLLRENQRIQANVTYAERPPAINELYSDGLHHGSASLEFGDSDLTKEKSLGVSLSYQLEKKRFNYNLYGYAQQIEDFIYLQPNGLDLTIRGAFPSYDWTNTDALIRGFDQTLSYSLTDRVEYGNKLSFLWGNNRSEDNFLVNMPPNQIENSLLYTVPVRNDSSSLKVKLGSQYVFRQKRFNEEEEFAPPPTDFLLFSAGITYQVKFSQKKAITIGVTADNLLNKVYRSYLNRFRYYTDEQGRNITFRLNYNF